MAERGSSQDRGPFQTLTLAGFGALALAAQRADELAEDLASRLGVDPEEMRAALSDTLESWRREAQRIGSSTSEAASRLVEDAGIARSEAVRELELRVAQLEHRLRLLERGS
jgi:polyhydroxyalkanoate synthesis regulator phasin